MFKTKKIKHNALSCVLLSLAFASSAMALDINKSIEDALKFGQADNRYGQVKADLRFRYENNDSDRAKTNTANAFTGRLRLGYLTPVFEGLQAYAEFQGNQDIGLNDYNNGKPFYNNKPQYEVIGDPQRNELDQLWFSFKGIPNTEAKVGRQRIELDNQRFIGSSPWRQLERTYEAALVTNTSITNSVITVGYIDQVQNPDATTDKIQLPLLNASYNFANIGKLTGYSYLMEFNDPLFYRKSNQTYGLRFDGKHAFNDHLTLLYTAEYALQRDYGRSGQFSGHYQEDYYNIVGGFNAYGITAKAGMEQLGGAGYGKTFNTPLASIHGFNGWTDLFLLTPDKGLRDVYANVETDVLGVKLTGQYHNFSSESGNKNYGDSWGFMASKEIFKHYTIMAKYMDFEANVDGMPIVNAHLVKSPSFIIPKKSG